MCKRNQRAEKTRPAGFVLGVVLAPKRTQPVWGCELLTVAAAHMLAHTDGMDKQPADWDIIKYDVLLTVLRAKFKQNPKLAEELVATGDRTIVNADTDSWAGMSAAGGIATGQNNVGKALMQVRGELRS